MLKFTTFGCQGMTTSSKELCRQYQITGPFFSKKEFALVIHRTKKKYFPRIEEQLEHQL